MILKLKNFRCYADHVFEFDDGAMTLLHGPSGRGKSTVLLAVRFALCGSADRFMTPYGKIDGGGCEVTLELENDKKKFKVVRTRQPNILTVHVDARRFQGAEAQAVLNSAFGLSAFRHGDTSKFLDMSNLEKLDFLEKIASSDYDVKDLKTRVKIEVADIESKLAVVQGQILQTETILEIVQKPPKVENPETPADLVGFQLERGVEADRSDALDRLKKCRLCEVAVGQLSGRIESLTKEAAEGASTADDASAAELIASKRLVDGQISNLVVESSLLETAKAKFETAQDARQEMDSDKYRDASIGRVRDLEAAVVKVQASIATQLALVDLRELKSIELEFDSLVDREKSDWLAAKAEIEQRVSEHSRLVDGEDLAELERLRYRVAEAEAVVAGHDENAVRTQMSSAESLFFKNYECFDCGATITVDMNTFRVASRDVVVGAPAVEDADPVDSLLSVRSTLAGLSETMRKIESAKTLLGAVGGLEKVEVKIVLAKKLKKLQKKQSKIQNFVPSAASEDLRRRAERLRLKIDPKIGAEDADVVDLDALKDKKRDLMVALNQESCKVAFKERLAASVKAGQEYDAKRHAAVVEDLKKLNDSTSELAIAVERAVVRERLLKQVGILTVEMESLTFLMADNHLLENRLRLLDLYVDHQSRRDAYKMFQKNLKKYKDLKSNLKGLVDRKKALEAERLTTLLFKQKVVESEHESLNFVVSLVNSHLSMFLDDFFPEEFGDRIQCRLRLDNDGRRPQVIVVVNYKGGLVDHRSLSTGEYARVGLALDLAFKEILDEKVVMLDERTANLDEDLSSIIFRKIKRSFPTKTVLVVAHQASLGCFDHSVSL